jgi:hypothetical protein
MPGFKELATTWNKVTGSIVGTAAAVVIAISIVNWFQPRASAEEQHSQISQDADEYYAQAKMDANRDGLESELERIELGLKLFASIQATRDLTPDEELQFGYLLGRHEQIIARLYDADDDDE